MIDSELRHGYYEYNSQPFFNRERVADEMALFQDFDSDLKFVFNPEIFDKINWDKPVGFNILDLYKARAVQLRQMYDYVILMFSGGSDSMQILHTFVKNKIKIDEIRIFSYDSMVQAYGEDKIALDVNLKIFLEYKNAALATIEKIKHLIPDTIITHYDMTDDCIRETKSKKYSHFIREGYPGISAYSHSPRFFTVSANQYNVRNYKENSCLIYGVEKPIIKFNMSTRELRFHFSDAVLRDYAYCRYYGRKDIKVEPFYWSADFPLIPVKQTQMIREYLETENEARKKFYGLYNKIQKEEDFLRRRYMTTQLARMFDALIYPNWVPETYSGIKPRAFRHEIFLYESVFGKTHSNEVLDEFNGVKKNKFKKFNKFAMTGVVLSKPYNLGKLPLPII